MSNKPKPIETAPKDGTWILLRGRNAGGVPMIPVVAAWCPPGSRGVGWRDSGSFKPVDDLASDAGADWFPLAALSSIEARDALLKEAAEAIQDAMGLGPLQSEIDDCLEEDRRSLERQFRKTEKKCLAVLARLRAQAEEGPRP